MNCNVYGDILYFLIRFSANKRIREKNTYLLTKHDKQLSPAIDWWIELHDFFFGFALTLSIDSYTITGTEVERERQRELNLSDILALHAYARGKFHRIANSIILSATQKNTTSSGQMKQDSTVTVDSIRDENATHAYNTIKCEIPCK